jgi:hypothetical protein
VRHQWVSFASAPTLSYVVSVARGLLVLLAVVLVCLGMAIVVPWTGPGVSLLALVVIIAAPLASMAALFPLRDDPGSPLVGTTACVIAFASVATGLSFNFFGLDSGSLTFRAAYSLSWGLVAVLALAVARRYSRRVARSPGPS